MKWLNSRRFIVCLACLAIIAHSAIFGECADTRIAESLVPVLVAFMGATTIDRAAQEFMKYKDKKGWGRKNEEDDDD